MDLINMSLRLYNTAARRKEDFISLHPPLVTMYNCGPTVYNYAHIGNLRAYVFADVLRRTLAQDGYTVRQVINITDVGHLVSDGDEGEDKMTLGALREGKSIEAIIAEYSDAFYADLKELNILAAEDRGKEEFFPRATHHIPEQQALITTLDAKGYVYVTSDGIYFDTNKFPRYADFAKLDVLGMQAGSRVAMGEKKNPTDFALWKFSPEDGKKREQEWDSPLGVARKGFPGWHLECSVMAMKYLGETIDIHTGGIDHIPVHHSNELAQSECATGKTFARYWMHSAFMTVDGQKMSKSLGNTYRLADLDAKGISPAAFRYWLLTAQYRTQINFTEDALRGGQHALLKLGGLIGALMPDNGMLDPLSAEEPNNKYWTSFKEAMNEDINTPQAIAYLWEMLRDQSIAHHEKILTLLAMDKFLGIGITGMIASAPVPLSFPKEIADLVQSRKTARDTKNWAESDRLREEIRKLGYEVKDTQNGQQLERI